MTRIWRCGEHALALDRPLVMGVLNVTPDSFSDGGIHEDPAAAVKWGARLVDEGAVVLDIGGESTRPGSTEVSAAEEIARVRPVVTRLSAEPVPVSIDTRHAEVAAACVEAGASIINDVGGFTDPAMVQVAVESQTGVVIMHMQGDPKTMQKTPSYNDVVAEVGGFLLAQAASLEAQGVSRERIMLDPGIGFGKTLEHNVELLRRLPELKAYGYPLLVGVSRKRFLGELSGEPDPSSRLGGSIAAALMAIEMGADMVRVHDVAQTLQAIAVAVGLRN